MDQEPIADLTQMIQNLQPFLEDEDYVFVTIPDPGDVDVQRLRPRCGYLEPEGLSLILRREDALAGGFAPGPSFRCIALMVPSSLEGVGLTAAVAGTLAAHGISANVVAAYHHDYVYVPAGRAEEALELLEELSRRPADRVLRP